MATIMKKICKSCGVIRIIVNSKCTQCGAKYTDGDVAQRKIKLEQLKILPGILKPTNGSIEINKPNTPDDSLYAKIRVEENNQSDEYAEAKCDYESDSFTFKEGDILTITYRTCDGFVEGTIGNLEGTFPAVLVKPFDNNPEKNLQVVEDFDMNYDGILKVQIGNIVKLKNKYSEYYWAEFEGKEGWIPVTSVKLISRNEANLPDDMTIQSTPKPPREKYGNYGKQDKKVLVDRGPPLPPRQCIRLGNEEEIRIIMLGKTGSGKSATGNSIIGQRFFKSNLSGKSVTKSCQRFEGICNGKPLVIIDTPGLFDTALSHNEINSEIIRCAHLSLPGPHVFLIVLQITRLTNEETEALEQLFDIFGTSMGDYAIIVFTRSDELKREQKSIESFVEETGPPITDFIRKCNNRYIAIDNSTTGQDKEEMVTTLVKALTDIVEDNHGNHFTNTIIEKAGEANVELNAADNFEKLDKSFYNPDEDLDLIDGDFEEYERDRVSLESFDSGVSMSNQPIYDEIHVEFRSTVIELNNRIDATQLEIQSDNSFKKNVEIRNEKDTEEINEELKKIKKEVLEVTANLDRVTNQCRALEQQKRELERKTKNDIQESDLKLKQLNKTKRGFEKQKKQIEQKKTELRQKISKESESLQTKLNTPQNGCLLM